MNLKLIVTILALSVGGALYASPERSVADTLGGAVSSIAQSPAEMLRGEISGVRVSAVDGNPNGHLNVNLRGLNTVRSESQPLWVVDGAILNSSLTQNLNAFYLSGGTTINGDKLPDYSGKHYVTPLGNFNWLNPYDIESIEVIKDLSATAVYGPAAANGVIIIKTKRPASGDQNIRLNSNFGVDLSSQKGEAFKTGFLTSHDLAVNGLFGTNSFYNISGFVRYTDTSVQNVGSTTGGLSVNVETTANEIFHFGLNSRLAYGEGSSSAGTNFIGQPSAMILSRYPDSFKVDKINGWLSSYVDEYVDYRTVNSIWVGINFMRNLKLRVSAGIDYQNQQRFIWHGTGTSFGKEFKGASGILSNSLLNYNAKGELSYSRGFAVKHNFQTKLFADLNGYSSMTNSMCGTNFDLPHLRGKGLSSSSSLHAIRKFARSYSRVGGGLMVGYDYDGIAGVRGSVRTDYTFRFDAKPIWLPSAEAFVDFKKMLLSRNSVVSTFKLTGGYGAAARDVTMPYEYVSSYITDVPVVEAGSEPYFEGLNRLSSREYNIGLHLGFLKDRYSVGVKYYDKFTSDSFRLYNFGKVVANLWVETENWQIHRQWMSSISNSGLEIDVDCRFIQSRTMTWTARASAAWSTSRMITLDSNDQNYVWLANALPLVYGGFGTTLSLYGLTLDADFSGAAGFEIVNANKLIETGSTEITEDNIEKGDYLRLDCLSLSYTIPLKSKKVKLLKVNVSGHNLFTLTGYSGWNPDVNSFGVNAGAYGIDYGSYPLRRQAVLGVSLKF